MVSSAAKKRPKKSRRKDATPLAVIARALAEAELVGDVEIARRYGVPRSTLRTWRMQASTEPELGLLLSAARVRLLEEWRPAVSSTLIAACRELKRRIESGDGLTTMELIGAIRTLGGMSVEAGALLGKPDADTATDPQTPK